jgi:hypothetical protein
MGHAAGCARPTPEGISRRLKAAASGSYCLMLLLCLHLVPSASQLMLMAARLGYADADGDRPMRPVAE